MGEFCDCNAGIFPCQGDVNARLRNRRQRQVQCSHGSRRWSLSPPSSPLSHESFPTETMLITISPNTFEKDVKKAGQESRSNSFSLESNRRSCVEFITKIKFGCGGFAIGPTTRISPSVDPVRAQGSRVRQQGTTRSSWDEDTSHPSAWNRVAIE